MGAPPVLDGYRFKAQCDLPSYGPVTIVAPVSAYGVTVPVLVSFATEHVRHTDSMAGTIAAALSIVLVSVRLVGSEGPVFGFYKQDFW